MKSKKYSELIIGWRIKEKDIDPAYWLSKNPKAGKQKQSDLVLIPANTLSYHTAIIAQSGSGKSYFLGRLIEEIVLKTKARCLVLDPNSDFSKIYEIEDESLWKNAKYDLQKRKGKLPTELNKAAFKKEWEKCSIEVKTNKNATDSDSIIKALRVPWSSLPVGIISDEIDPLIKSDISHCHSFLRNVEKLLKIEYYLDNSKSNKNVLDESEELLDIALSRKETFNKFLKLQFSSILEFIASLESKSATKIDPKDKEILSPIVSILEETKLSQEWFLDYDSDAELLVLHKYLNFKIQEIFNNLINTSNFISEKIYHYYFSKAREYENTKIFNTLISEFDPQEDKSILKIIDLPSIPDETTRTIVINSILSEIWEDARNNWKKALNKPESQDKRAPLFLIVDEAHNIIPENAHSRAKKYLKEQFKTIVAEGRKYGVFLILVSQRPDKLDPLILSECENVALMKLSTEAVLKKTKELLNIGNVEDNYLKRCIEFRTGRVLITGKWLPEKASAIFYTAARRTIEGGRNLKAEYWAKKRDEKA